MSNENQEIERLKRLREQQLRARDPHVKQRQFQRTSAERERKRDTSYSLRKLWRDLPLILRYSIFGFLFGLLVFFMLPLFWDSPWVTIVSIVIVLVITIFSALVGNAVAAREKIKDLIR